MKKRESDSSHIAHQQDKKQWTGIKNQEIPFENKKAYLLWGWLTLEQVLQRCCRLFICGNTQNTTRHGKQLKVTLLEVGLVALKKSFVASMIQWFEVAGAVYLMVLHCASLWHFSVPFPVSYHTFAVMKDILNIACGQAVSEWCLFPKHISCCLWL